MWEPAWPGAIWSKGTRHWKGWSVHGFTELRVFTSLGLTEQYRTSKQNKWTSASVRCQQKLWKVNLYTYDLKAYFASFTSNKYQKYTLRCMELFLPSPDVSYATREGTITGSLAVVVFHNWLNHRLSKSPYCVKSRLSHASRSFLRLCRS